jgi:hypothetical protein
MRRLSLAAAAAIGLAVVAIVLTTPRPVEASIHEIIAALCRSGGEEVAPFGQNKDGNSFLRALQATGFIESIDTSDPSKVVINFNPDVPNSKFKDAGVGDLTLEDFIAPGVDLVLSPLVDADLDFPAHANCHNLK